MRFRKTSYLSVTRVLTVFFLFLIVSLPAYAERAGENTVDKVIVTANRVLQPLVETPSATVITRADIEASPATDLATIMSREAGIDVTSSGGSANQASLFLRGSNSNHTLILINGVKVSSLNTGAFPFEDLPLDLVERIEVVRGPCAALWGADAIGGVIQITTREPNTHLSLRAGSHSTYGFSAGFNTETERFKLGTSASWEDSAGYNVTTPSSWSYDPDKDPYTRKAVTVKASTNIGLQNLTGHVTRSDLDAAFDRGRSQSTQNQYAFNISGDVSRNLHQNTTLAHTTFDLVSGVSEYSTERTHAEVLGSFFTSLVGISFLKEEGSNYTGQNPVYEDSRTNMAIFASQQLASPSRKVVATFSGRYEDSSVYGSHPSGSVSLMLNPADRFHLTASVAEGYRSPTFNELYHPGYGGNYAGNPNLHPEESLAYEIAASLVTNVGDFKASVFYTDYKDLIANTGPRFSMANTNSATAKGAEFSYLYDKSESIDFGFNISYVRAWNNDSNTRQLRRAPKKANAHVTLHPTTNLSFTVDTQLSSGAPDFGVNLPGYVLFNATARYAFADHWSLQAKVNNISDHAYTLVDGYATPGRTFMLYLNYR